MRKILLICLAIAGGLLAQPTAVRVVGPTNTQAVLAYNSPDDAACTLELSESASYTPLVHDVDTGYYTGANADSRAGNITIGRSRVFVLGKRSIELATTGTYVGKYFSRALQSNTKHYYRLTCTAGNVTGSFYTLALPNGNTYGEPFQGDLANPGAAPYPYLDPSVRNSSYIDPQTGLKHVAFTFGSDYFETYGSFPATNQPYSDAVDMNGATWASPTNAYGTGTATTSTTGTGNLWVGVRNTQLSNTYDFPGRGPSYDEYTGYAANGSINWYQVSIDAKVSSSTDSITACLTVDRSTCATPNTTLSLTTSFQTFLVGTFPMSGLPNGSNGGSGSDPVLFNATPAINRWQAYTHMGTVNTDGAGNVTYVTGNNFNTAWGSSSFLRFSTLSTANACAAGTAHNIASVTNGNLLVLADMPAAGPYYYCANNFGVLIKRVTPDGRTVSVQNVKFNISYSLGPVWFSTADQTPLSYVSLSGGYYLLVAASSAPMLLYFFDPVAGTSTLIGPMKPNSNTSGADQWLYYQIPDIDVSPFDNVASTSTGRLVWYNAGLDVNGKTVIIRTELSGTPAYQLNSAALMDESGATITHPDAFSVQVVNHGMTAKFTNITPASTGKDLYTQMAGVTGFQSSFMTITFGGAQNGKLYLQGRGNQDTIATFARIDPTNGLIDKFTNSWSQVNCRWCQDHSGIIIQGDVNYMGLGANSSRFAGNTTDGAGPWIVTTTNAISASPSLACPSNSVGAPTTGTQCDTFTLTSHGGANPFEPYDPDPGTHETDFLQAAIPGDRFCVSTTTLCLFNGEIMMLVAKSGSSWTVWRPPAGIINSVGPVTIAGAGTKNFYAYCTAAGLAPDANGVNQGDWTGTPQWDTTTSSTTATWYVDQQFIGGHTDFKYNSTFGGVSVPGLFAEVCQESIFCGTVGTDRAQDGYRIRQGSLPGLLSTTPTYAISTPIFSGATGVNGSGSHLSVGGLSAGFTDNRPFLGDGLGITWTLVGGTSHVYLASSTIPLNRKFLITAAVAGPHVLKDISSTATGAQITDATDYSYCVALASNECRAGSSVGNVFVSASSRTYLGCYNGSSSVDVFTVYGNVQEDICVFPGGNNSNSVQQFSTTADPVGWKYSRVLTYLAGKNKMDDAFANVRVLPDSSWVLGMERWGTYARNEVVAIKMPPLGSPTDSINRGAFIPVQVQLNGVAGADGAVADFGYAEFGSDGVTKFYGTSRQENTLANQSTVGATPFYWASETFTPLSCSSGCTLTIPALPGHVLYYRVRRLLSGTTVLTGQTEVRAIP